MRVPPPQVFEQSLFLSQRRSLCLFLRRSVRPQAVLLTGDVTSAKDPLDRTHGSGQIEEEWKEYRLVFLGGAGEGTFSKLRMNNI